MRRLQKQSNEILELGPGPVGYTLVRSRRKTLQIVIYPSGRIEVRAPLYTASGDIQRMVNGKKGWIEKKLEGFKKSGAHHEPPAYTDGSRHQFLGQSLELKIISARKNSVQFGSKTIEVMARQTNPEYIERLVTRQLAASAFSLFQDLTEKTHARMTSWKIPVPVLKTRWMKTRWGSCSVSGVITLNLELMRYPVAFIEYVVAHELAHLVEHNHSSRFYAVLATLLPDWKERRKIPRNDHREP